MAKVILTLSEMPESCLNCQLAVRIFKNDNPEMESCIFCSGAGKELAESWIDLYPEWNFSIPNWCPLQEVSRENLC